jgi:hypothetical protein
MTIQVLFKNGKSCSFDIQEDRVDSDWLKYFMEKLTTPYIQKSLEQLGLIK